MCVVNRLYVDFLIMYFFRNKFGIKNDIRMLYIIMNFWGGNEWNVEIYIEYWNMVIVLGEFENLYDFILWGGNYMNINIL